MTTRSDETPIEQARRQLEKIPDDWLTEPCANQCGQIVFVPPEVRSAPIAILATCSEECATAVSSR